MGIQPSHGCQVGSAILRILQWQDVATMVSCAGGGVFRRRGEGVWRAAITPMGVRLQISISEGIDGENQLATAQKNSFQFDDLDD